MYNADHTLVMTGCSRSGARTGTSYYPNQVMMFEQNGRECNRGVWSLEEDRFCYTWEQGPSAGHQTCKTGRLIGRVRLDGSPLAEPMKR